MSREQGNDAIDLSIIAMVLVLEIAESDEEHNPLGISGRWRHYATKKLGSWSSVLRWIAVAAAILENEWRSTRGERLEEPPTEAFAAWIVKVSMAGETAEGAFAINLPDEPSLRAKAAEIVRESAN